MIHGCCWASQKYGNPVDVVLYQNYVSNPMFTEVKAKNIKIGAIKGASSTRLRKAGRET